MKSVTASFFCMNPAIIKDIYSPAQTNRLKELCNLTTDVFSTQDVEAGKLSETDVLFSTWGMASFTDEQLEKMPNLKAVFYAAGATDSFCHPLFRKQIQLFSAWKANSIPVAEFTVAQITLGLKNYFQMLRFMKDPQTYSACNRAAGCGMYGARVALLGNGMISQHVQALLKSYDVEIIVIPSHPSARTISLEEAFATSQVVSNHFPNRDDNGGVFNGKLFESMHPGAVFINTGRGCQINEPEMIKVLRKRPDLTVLLDVTWPEPPKADSPLYSLPNVFLSPHIAGSLHDEWHRMADYMIDDFERWIKGEVTQNAVDPKKIITAK